jgi:hypothetical protein
LFRFVGLVVARAGMAARVGKHYSAPSGKKFQKNLSKTLKFSKTLP